jgi:CRP/FNR family transcriptional regulator
VLSKLEALGRVRLFAGLDEESLRAILARCVEKVYLKNEMVFHEGEEPKALFVVWRGSVKVFKLAASGREQILEIEGEGRSVAELPLMDGDPYPASCAALEDSVLLTVPARDFHRLLEEHPAITRSVIASLAQRMRRMVTLVEEISLKAVRERLADLLVELAGEGDRVELSWTHQEIAARIGTVREIVSRTLARMGHEGVIRQEGRTVTLLDREGLRGAEGKSGKS